ncbi:DNA polymerase delta small subunit Cdc1 [Schizosaccharomyces japonicus yFS275]|uniref:DNA polymerase delta small subunit Cdc1 n=1 Tax=Schizosaccharomyces japonicus (strain yFS275 / FY16936) TaxID=402676 RepID=B6K801_SCHJY|nr:DNA polymerase delta small subunit Cdc1 [Schizosaccharomyces japonicus yFS275]EEB09655.2 DNA polymerase delta small subunit Cdc1 [Schizosaccharomyces japonicus yFS275]
MTERTNVECLELKKKDFVLDTNSYNQQYASIYFARLNKLMPRTIDAARTKWPKYKQLDRVLEVKKDQVAWIVGTVYLSLALKPNVLADVTSTHTINTELDDSLYVNPNEADPSNMKCFIEDGFGRVECVLSSVIPYNLVTGVVVAALGHEDEQGLFLVQDVCTAGMGNISIPRPLQTDCYIALMSGLGLASDTLEHVHVHLAVEFLRGQLPMFADVQASQIARLLLLGNCLASPTVIRENLLTKLAKSKKKQPKRYGYDTSLYDPNPMVHTDNLLYELCSSIDVTLMPGAFDFSTRVLPQQPLHPALLTRSKEWLQSSLQTTTNPTWLEIEGRSILATSGQNIEDLHKYYPDNSPLALMEASLNWNHIAPTTPDTLWCYPFPDKDVFIIDKMPHVYMCGNQPSFGTKPNKTSKWWLLPAYLGT